MLTFAKEKLRLSKSSGSRELNKFLKISLIMLMASFGNCVLASDNVLQAIQINGVKDSYNIILKSDDVAEVRKTVQAPNKMVLNLKGIRASKTINTIYSNTASVDSVVVEPVNDETVKIFIQGQNVANAQVHFDSLKTPLGVLGNSQSSQNKSSGEVVLNDPMATYKPVYDDSNDEDESGFFGDASGSFLGLAKNALKSDKLSWLVTGLLFSIVIMGGVKSIKGNDNDIKVGLSQSLKDREVNLYGGLTGLNVALPEPSLGTNKPLQHQGHIAGAKFGLKAYQDGSRNPYTTSEVQRPRVQARPQTAPQPLKTPVGVGARQMSAMAQNSAMQSTIQKPTMATMAPTATMTQQRTTQQRATQQRASNIDSIKFLESMTKIYEKNGRSDLAQGLKTNMKKAKANLA